MAQHATLGASSAYRWMACPGSVRLSTGQPSRSSEYAMEGTAAHKLGEHCLKRSLPAAHFLGKKVFVEDAGYTVTPEMADAVQVWLDVVEERGSGYGKLVLVEQKVDLDTFGRPGMFGTADTVVHDPVGTLDVVDFKYGVGIPVEVKDNPQLRYYGLGALTSLALRPIYEVRLTIVQPRAEHPDGPVRSEYIDTVDLIEFAGELLTAAARTDEPDAPLVPGEHCRFCPAAGICPALRDKALDEARFEFGRKPEAMPAVDVAALLDQAELIEIWLRAVRSHACGMLEFGAEIPGWKLVPRRGRRRWVDADAAGDALEAVLPVEKIYEPPVLKSPAQLEKLTEFKRLKPEEREALMADLITSESSGSNLARDSDLRPPVAPSAFTDFGPVE